MEARLNRINQAKVDSGAKRVFIEMEVTASSHHPSITSENLVRHLEGQLGKVCGIFIDGKSDAQALTDKELLDEVERRMTE